jgi:hypothetical protein
MCSARMMPRQRGRVLASRLAYCRLPVVFGIRTARKNTNFPYCPRHHRAGWFTSRPKKKTAKLGGRLTPQRYASSYYSTSWRTNLHFSFFQHRSTSSKFESHKISFHLESCVQLDHRHERPKPQPDHLGTVSDSFTSRCGNCALD